MKILLKPPQWKVFRCPERFRVLVAGRRFGKTYLVLTELVQAAWGPGRKAWYVAPTYRQAKRVAWNALKQMTKPYWAAKPNETDLTIELISGGAVSLRGAENYHALRGDGLDFIVLDEYASMAPQAWTEVLRPALADKLGRALFIGTPRGHNHLFELHEFAQGQPGWAAFQFTTEQGGNVPREELESATHELDERTYRQEFQATFETLGVGLAYFAFDRASNVRQVIMHKSSLQLFWALDFNVNPLCSVVGQTNGILVHILDELILPNSNTLAACEEFLDRTKDLPGRPLNVDVYGDATGEQQKTSASRTDWQIVRNFFGRYTDRFRASFQVRSTNPAVKDRINCMNAMLRNHAGQHRLLIASHCKQLIKDFERVCWKADAYGNPLAELDKSDPMRTHASDALGYFIAHEFPMRAKFGERGGPSIG